MEVIQRGDILVAAQRGAMTGKTRPILVIQNDLAATEHKTLSACLITTELSGASLIRTPVSPAAENGLDAPSEVQIDQIHTFRKTSVGRKIGRLSADQMQRVDEALRRWLSL